MQRARVVVVAGTLSVVDPPDGASLPASPGADVVALPLLLELDPLRSLLAVLPVAVPAPDVALDALDALCVLSEL